MRSPGLGLRHLHLYQDGDRVWPLFVKLVFLQFNSLKEQNSWVKRRPKLDSSQTEGYLTFSLFCRADNARGGITNSSSCRGLVTDKCDNVLGETLGFDDNQLTNLFRKTLGTEPMDNNQITCQCYQGALPLRDKRFRHRCAETRTCPICEQSTLSYSARRFRIYGFT